MTDAILRHNGKIVGFAIAGGTLGVVTAGPVGAVAGGLLGAIIGDAIAEPEHKQLKKES